MPGKWIFCPGKSWKPTFKFSREPCYFKRCVCVSEMGMEIKDSSPQQLLRDGALASAATGGGSAEEEEAERMWEVMEARTKLK